MDMLRRLISCRIIIIIIYYWSPILIIVLCCTAFELFHAKEEIRSVELKVCLMQLFHF